MGNFILRWLRPSPAGPVDRATYRLRLVLAVQIAVFGLVGFLVLALGRSMPPLLALPELAAHVLLGLLLWTNRITWGTILAVAGLGVADTVIGDSGTVEVMLVFFIIPLVLPFYTRTAIALTTQILVWVMVAGTGIGMVVTAPDRMPWISLVAQLGAIGLVGTLMVIFRFSLLRLIGANQRLENVVAQYQAVYENGGRATLVLSRYGHIRSVHGSASQLLGIVAFKLVGQHYSAVLPSVIGEQEVWETYLQDSGPEALSGAWVHAEGPENLPLIIHLAAATSQQRTQGMALVADIYASGAPSIGEGFHDHPSEVEQAGRAASV